MVTCSHNYLKGVVQIVRRFKMIKNKYIDLLNAEVLFKLSVAQNFDRFDDTSKATQKKYICHPSISFNLEAFKV